MRLSKRKFTYRRMLTQDEWEELAAACTPTATTMLLCISAFDPDYPFPTCDEFYDCLGYTKKQITKTKRARFQEAIKILTDLGILMKVENKGDPLWYVNPYFAFGGTRKHQREQYQKIKEMQAADLAE